MSSAAEVFSIRIVKYRQESREANVFIVRKANKNVKGFLLLTMKTSYHSILLVL